MKPEIGDLVQWESQGVPQFPEPRKVRGFTDDGLRAYVEGSNSGLLFAELEIVERSEGEPGVATSNTSENSSGVPDMRKETFVLDTGQVQIEWPSKMSEASFEDFKDWLKILERKVGRTVTAEKSEEDEQLDYLD